MTRKNIMFILLRRIIYITLGCIDQILGRKTHHVVLCYHSIGNAKWRFTVTQKMFEKQMSTLIKTHKPVLLSQLAGFILKKTKIPDYSFTVTFDDGYKDIMDTSDFCKKNHIVPIVFVLAHPEKADRKVLENELPLLNSSECKKLLKEGWEIGSHGSTHIVLPPKGKETLTKEIVQSKKILEKDLEIKIVSFAYPKGKYSDRVVRMVQEAGYQSGVSMDDSQISKAVNSYIIPRVGVDGSHSMTEFQYLYSPSVIEFRRLVKKSPLGKYF